MYFTPADANLCHHMSAEAFFRLFTQTCRLVVMTAMCICLRPGCQIYHLIWRCNRSNVSQCLWGSAGTHMINNVRIFMYLSAAGREKKEKENFTSAPHAETAGTRKGRETNVTGRAFRFCARRSFFFRGGLLHVTQGTHQQRVKALIT